MLYFLKTFQEDFTKINLKKIILFLQHTILISVNVTEMRRDSDNLKPFSESLYSITSLFTKKTFIYKFK